MIHGPAARMLPRRSRIAVVFVGVALLTCVDQRVADANEYADKDLSVRLASAFIRFTEISAFGGETAANRWSPAVNPAAADWTAVPSRYGVVAAPFYSHISLDQGSAIDIYGEAALWDTRRYGSFQPTFSQLRSNKKLDRQGLEFDYETNTFQLQWGLRHRNRAVGAAFNYNTSKVTQRLAGLTLSRTTADTYRIRVGGLYEPRRRLLVGGVVEYGWSPYSFSALVPTRAGFLPTSGKDTQEQVILRGGASYEYRELSTVSVDYQYGWFENDRSTLKTHRFSAGVQHRVLKFLFARAGATTDEYGNAGYSAGVTVAFSRWGQVDIGYQHDVLPELQSTFGGSDILQVVLSIRL